MNPTLYLLFAAAALVAADAPKGDAPKSGGPAVSADEAASNEKLFAQVSKVIEDARKKSAAGMVMINLPTAGVDYHVPFGGQRGSSYGQREQGFSAVTVKIGRASCRERVSSPV